MGFNAAALMRRVYCLDAVSKNVRGEIVVINAQQKSCSNPGCEPLTLVHGLRLALRSSRPCDGKRGQILDGEMQIGNLTTVFTGQREHLRGLHAADFLWTFTSGGSVAGTLEGITNAGIIRPCCESCDQ